MERLLGGALGRGHIRGRVGWLSSLCDCRMTITDQEYYSQPFKSDVKPRGRAVGTLDK
jgi:hypothetical protein